MSRPEIEAELARVRELLCDFGCGGAMYRHWVKEEGRLVALLQEN